jgi:hypothetical protein
LFAYNPETGSIKWRLRPATTGVNKRFNARYGGKEAGTVGKSGYVSICIREPHEKFITFYAHRIIWKLMTGDDPSDQVDHEDTVRSNNRWKNLRSASNGSNIQNSRLRKDNKSGVKGVCWDAWHGKWQTQITYNKITHRFGRFDTVEQASSVVNTARIRLHGEFARPR